MKTLEERQALAKRILETQTILHLHACSIEELFDFYRNSDSNGVFVDKPPDYNDTTLMCYIYSLGQLRFGRRAWGDHQIEHFKKRARELAAIGITANSYPKPKQVSLSDLDL